MSLAVSRLRATLQRELSGARLLGGRYRAGKGPRTVSPDAFDFDSRFQTSLGLSPAALLLFSRGEPLGPTPSVSLEEPGEAFFYEAPLDEAKPWGARNKGRAQGLSFPRVLRLSQLIPRNELACYR